MKRKIALLISFHDMKHRHYIVENLTKEGDHIMSTQQSSKCYIALLCCLLSFFCIHRAHSLTIIPQRHTDINPLQLVRCYKSACWYDDFGSEALITWGWGYHALYWQTCFGNDVFGDGITFYDYYAWPPTGSTVFFGDQFTLNDNDNDPNVFSSDPRGGWECNSACWNSEELAIAAALFADHWMSPTYTNLDILEYNGDFNEAVAITSICFSGSDPASACDWLGWPDSLFAGMSFEEAASLAYSCEFSYDFTIDEVTISYWDFYDEDEDWEYYETATLSGYDFANAFGDGVQPYIMDPPSGYEGLARAFQLYAKRVGQMGLGKVLTPEGQLVPISQVTERIRNSKR